MRRETQNQGDGIARRAAGAIRQAVSKFTVAKVVEDCGHLVGDGGESSGRESASALLGKILQLDPSERAALFIDLVSKECLAGKGDTPRGEDGAKELWRRINWSEGGIFSLIKIREELIDLAPLHPELRDIEIGLENLLSEWLNPGLLVLRSLDWNSPASLLEKIMKLEAVHAVRGWDDIKRRVARDRRIFAFFHPALPEDPLIFVEVALLKDAPTKIGPLLDPLGEVEHPRNFRTAVFYSISNCHPGLRGISLGNFLIKRVVGALMSEFPQLKKFRTISPVPSLVKFYEEAGVDGVERSRASELAREEALRLRTAGAGGEAGTWGNFCAAYLLATAPSFGDPVARFHLDNGAQLDMILDNADESELGQRRSRGVMASYLYNLGSIESNCVSFRRGRVVASRSVRRRVSRGTGFFCGKWFGGASSVNPPEVGQAVRPSPGQ